MFRGVLQYGVPLLDDPLGGEYPLTFRFSEDQVVTRISII